MKNCLRKSVLNNAANQQPRNEQKCIEFVDEKGELCDEAEIDQQLRINVEKLDKQTRDFEMECIHQLIDAMDVCWIIYIDACFSNVVIQKKSA